MSIGAGEYRCTHVRRCMYGESASGDTPKQHDWGRHRLGHPSGHRRQAPKGAIYLVLHNTTSYHILLHNTTYCT